MSDAIDLICEKVSHNDIEEAMKAFLKKGGNIQKLPKQESSYPSNTSIDDDDLSLIRKHQSAA